MRPEHCGLSPEREGEPEIHPPADSRDLVAGDEAARAPLSHAAHGCAVTAINGHSDMKTGLLNNAEVESLPGRIDHHSEGLREWAPSADRSLSAVVCTPAAFSGLTARQRSQVIGVLQSATEDGGVHLVATIIAGQSGVSVSELRKSYKGWEVSVVEDGASGKSFLARKAVA
jgi:hypothetical protein